MNINFRPDEIDWLNNYAGNHDMSVEAAVRQAVRWLSIIEGVPGVREAASKLIDAKIDVMPKYDPMPPLESFRLRRARCFHGVSHENHCNACD